MSEGSVKRHNEKFGRGDLVQVMNISNHPLKNKTLQLVDCIDTDEYGCDVWVVLYDYENKTYTGKASTSCFNRL
jgi:hypothetical protein